MAPIPSRGTQARKRRQRRQPTMANVVASLRAANAQGRAARRRKPARRARPRGGGGSKLSAMGAMAAVRAIAATVHPEHALASGGSYIGGGTTTSSMKFTKKLKTTITGASANPVYFCYTPNATSDVNSLVMKASATPLTYTQTHTTPDIATKSAGSLWAEAAFASGALEARCVGAEFSITPVSSNFTLEGCIRYRVAHEGAPVATNSIVADCDADIRSKLVTKVRGQKVCMVLAHQNQESHTNYGTDGFVSGFPELSSPIAGFIQPDGAVATSFIVSITEHWEVTGHTVATFVTPNAQNDPLWRRIHHGIGKVYNENKGVYMPPRQVADKVSKVATGFSFQKLLDYGTKAVSYATQGAQLAQTITPLLSDISGGMADLAIADVLPDIAELGMMVAI